MGLQAEPLLGMSDQVQVNPNHKQPDAPSLATMNMYPCQSQLHLTTFCLPDSIYKTPILRVTRFLEPVLIYPTQTPLVLCDTRL